MIGHRFTQYIPDVSNNGGFENLLKIFLQLIVVTSGDVSEALNWMNELDRKYNLTDENYGMGDFIDDLKNRDFIKEDESNRVLNLTVKSERTIRRRSLEEIFNKLKKSTRGNHTTPYSGHGDELTSERREYIFGDQLDQIDVTNSIKNAQINHGIDDFKLTERDIEIHAKEMLKTRDTLYNIFVKHTGKTMEQISKDCDRDYFLTSAEAKEYHLIDNILQTRGTPDKK